MQDSHAELIIVLASSFVLYRYTGGPSYIYSASTFLSALQVKLELELQGKNWSSGGAAVSMLASMKAEQ